VNIKIVIPAGNAGNQKNRDVNVEIPVDPCQKHAGMTENSKQNYFLLKFSEISWKPLLFLFPE